LELKTVIITQARTGSSRLPEKVLLQAVGKTFLQIHAERLCRSKQTNEVIIATTVNANDIKIVNEAARLGIKCSRGSEDDVLSRYYHAAKEAGADIVVRVTSDCPFADPALIDELIVFFKNHQFDYVANVFVYTYPDGLDVEVMSYAALEYAYQHAVLKSEREHVTPYIRNQSDMEGGKTFKAYNYANAEKLTTLTRLTLDEPADLEVLSFLAETLGTERPWKDYYNYLENNPHINKINNYISANEGYEKSLQQDASNN